ncbi:MAG TPA: hypothetical protein VNQ73_16550 [Ilumatobacter sp.]|nr:hypothetical protein [Ilumatobacter sp.]
MSALLLVGFFTVGALRVTNTAGDVQAAARVGARAAATARNPASGKAAAEAVVATALADRGVACAGGPDVAVDRNAAGLATVSVTCVVNLDDVDLAGFTIKTLTATASERVDPLRGGDG